MALALLYRGLGVSVTKPSSHRSEGSDEQPPRGRCVRLCVLVCTLVCVLVCTLVCVPVCTAVCTRGSPGEPALPLRGCGCRCSPAPLPPSPLPRGSARRLPPTPGSVGRLRLRGAARGARAPPAAVPARAERRARGVRGAPSPPPSDHELRRGGRGEQVSAGAGREGAGKRSEGGRAERGEGAAGPHIAACRPGFAPLEHPAPGSAPAFARAGRGLPGCPGIPLRPHKQRALRRPHLPAWGAERAEATRLHPDCGPVAAARARRQHLAGAGGPGVAQVPAREAAARAREAPCPTRRRAHRRRCSPASPRLSRGAAGARAAAGARGAFTSGGRRGRRGGRGGWWGAGRGGRVAARRLPCPGW